MWQPRFDKKKNDEQDAAGDQRGHHDAAGKSESRRFNQSVNKCAETECGKNGTQPVNAVVVAINIFAHMDYRNEKDSERDRQIDKERCPPRHRSEEHTSE